MYQYQIYILLQVNGCLINISKKIVSMDFTQEISMIVLEYSAFLTKKLYLGYLVDAILRFFDDFDT